MIYGCKFVISLYDTFRKNLRKITQIVQYEVLYLYALSAIRPKGEEEEKILNDAVRGTLKSSHLSIDKSVVGYP